MLFATADYIKYRFGLGKYSTDSILKERGMLLASPTLLASIGDVKPGSLFFLHTKDSFLSWLVMYYSNSIWSHCGVTSEGNNVIDATTSGVIEHPLRDYLDGRSIICIYKFTSVSDLKLRQTLEQLREHIGRPYGWGKAIKIFFVTVMGKKDSYRAKFSLDLMLLLALVTSLVGPTPFVVAAASTIACVYIARVSLNVVRRRRKAKISSPGV